MSGSAAGPGEAALCSSGEQRSHWRLSVTQGSLSKRAGIYLSLGMARRARSHLCCQIKLQMEPKGTERTWNF